MNTYAHVPDRYVAYTNMTLLLSFVLPRAHFQHLSMCDTLSSFQFCYEMTHQDGLQFKISEIHFWTVRSCLSNMVHIFYIASSYCICDCLVSTVNEGYHLHTLLCNHLVLAFCLQRVEWEVHISWTRQLLSVSTGASTFQKCVLVCETNFLSAACHWITVRLH